LQVEDKLQVWEHPPYEPFRKALLEAVGFEVAMNWKDDKVRYRNAFKNLALKPGPSTEARL